MTDIEAIARQLSENTERIRRLEAKFETMEAAQSARPEFERSQQPQSTLGGVGGVKPADISNNGVWLAKRGALICHVSEVDSKQWIPLKVASIDTGEDIGTLRKAAKRGRIRSQLVETPSGMRLCLNVEDIRQRSEARRAERALAGCPDMSARFQSPNQQVSAIPHKSEETENVPVPKDQAAVGKQRPSKRG